MTIPSNAKQLTTEAYDMNAAALAERYNKLDRREYIAWIFDSVTKTQPFVFEIGCGSGRDAKELLKRTNRYLGMDISEGLLAFARKNVPDASFIQGDIETIELPENIDLVYSSASLLHVNKEALGFLLKRLYNKLTPGGLVYLSLKESDSYREEVQIDTFGTRIFYHYSLQDIEAMGADFKVAKLQHRKHERDIPWLEILLQKN